MNKKNRSSYSKMEAISFYDHDKKAAFNEYDLHFALGRVGNFALTVKRISSTSSSTEYKISICISSEYYNFEKWSSDEVGSFTKFINNTFGYLPQYSGTFHPYYFGIAFSYKILKRKLVST